MTTPHSLHHSLLRPCILHILRATGYSSTRPSVLDTLTDMAARYMYQLATATVNHAELNGSEDEITIEDVRMALEECGAFAPQKILEDELIDGEEDTRGVDAFIAWASSAEAKDIQRVALEGADDVKEDYLTVLKKKHDKTEDGSRYYGTIFGNPTEPRPVTVEGGEITSLKDWEESLRNRSTSRTASTNGSRPGSSDLSSLGDQYMEGMDFD